MATRTPTRRVYIDWRFRWDEQVGDYYYDIVDYETRKVLEYDFRKWDECSRFVVERGWTLVLNPKDVFSAN